MIVEGSHCEKERRKRREAVEFDDLISVPEICNASL